MAKLGRAIAGLGAVVAGYAKGTQINANNERIKRQEERDDKRWEYEQEDMKDKQSEREMNRGRREDAKKAWEPEQEVGTDPLSANSVSDIALRSAKPEEMMQTTIPRQEGQAPSLAMAKMPAPTGMGGMQQAAPMESVTPATSKPIAAATPMAVAAPKTRRPLPHEAYAKQAQFALQRGDTENGYKLMELAKNERVKYAQATLDEARKGGWQGIVDAANKNDGVPNNNLKVVDIDGGFELQDTDASGQTKVLQRFDNRNGSKDAQLYTFAGVRLGVMPYKDYDSAIAAQSKSNRDEDRQATNDKQSQQLKDLQIRNEQIKLDYESNPEVMASKLKENGLKITKLKADINQSNAAAERYRSLSKSKSNDDDELDFGQMKSRDEIVQNTAQKVAQVLSRRGANIETTEEKDGDVFNISPDLLNQVELLTMNGISQSEIIKLLGDRDEKGNSKSQGIYQGKVVLKTSKGLLPLN